MTEFFQNPPKLGNTYEGDKLLQSYLQRILPRETLQAIEPDLKNFGERAVNDLLTLSQDAEDNPPKLIQYDPWGRRIDQIQLARGWKELDSVSASEGLVAIGYERTYGALSRIYQFAKLYLFHPSSAVYTCPLAMTDGAARLIEVQGEKTLKQTFYPHFVSRDPKYFWTSGRWMTERTGGSDVSGTETIARFENGTVQLYGTKWFASATTAQTAITLARMDDGRDLSLFGLRAFGEGGQPDTIQILRLKDKLGTRALPTAELTLVGAKAHLIGSRGNGVKKITTVLNMTRTYNTICAVAAMRRSIILASEYAKIRSAFGKTIAEHPLHRETLANLEVEFAGAFHLAFCLVELMGKEELKTATEAEILALRILTPIAKLYTGKQALNVVSEAIECFGGAGYIEDTRLPILLRDVQVLSLWEGTTNVLSLDVLRAIEKQKAFLELTKLFSEKLSRVENTKLSPTVAKTKASWEALISFLKTAREQPLDYIETNARRFSFAVAQTVIASLLIEHAEWSLRNGAGERDLFLAKCWSENHSPLPLCS